MVAEVAKTPPRCTCIHQNVVSFAKVIRLVLAAAAVAAAVVEGMPQQERQQGAILRRRFQSFEGQQEDGSGAQGGGQPQVRQYLGLGYKLIRLLCMFLFTCLIILTCFLAFANMFTF